MSKVNSNLMRGFQSGSGFTNVLVWNNIGLDSSIDYGEVDSGDISKCLVGVCL